MEVEHNRIAVKCFANNVRAVNSGCEEMSQEQSLLPMEFGHNCVSWSLGHMLTYRKFILEVLGETGLDWPKETEELYSAGKELEEATAAAAQGPTLQSLLERLRHSQELLEAKLKEQDLADFEGEHEFFGGEPTKPKSIVEFLLWHDTFHAGEIGVQATSASQRGG